jgi:hypothetical protein
LTAGERLPTPAERYQKVVAALAGEPTVDNGAELGRPRRGFGASSLMARGRIFALLSSSEEFVVKLPRQRVDALVSTGAGKRWDAGKGRPMKEWLVVSPGSEKLWLPLAREALNFASNQ